MLAMVLALSVGDAVADLHHRDDGGDADDDAQQVSAERMMLRRRAHAQFARS